MTVTTRIARFWREEDGAVTVDWVVLTAAILLLGSVTGFVVTSSVPHLADTISSHVANKTVGVN